MENRTLTILKPDAVAAGYSGKILAEIEEAGFKITALRMFYLDLSTVSRFYAEHKGKPFYERLINFMSSGPCICAVLQKENAVAGYRMLVGATDPAEAAPETLRSKYGTGTPQNAIHASDSPQSAAREIDFFFSDAVN